MNKYTLLLASLASCLWMACRGEDPIVPSTPTEVTGKDSLSSVKGFFLLNEGNMGSNKCTIDYFDYESGVYTKNIYAERNPGVVKELGDVGNDLQIYGRKLYAVINRSNFVEVMDVATARHLTQISIPNCRYITFDGGFAYVTSYAGPVLVDPNARLGYVAKIDTATLTVVDTCTVGYQPEEMAIVGRKLYVANSGGYRVPNYDRTLSVIDLDRFQVIDSIDIAINLHRLERDRFGRLYVSSRGDMYDIAPKTYVVNTDTDEVEREIPLLSVGNMTICGDSLYAYNSDLNYATGRRQVSFALYNTLTERIDTRHFITDGTEEAIAVPYGVAVNPLTREFFVTDAKDFVTPGTLYCFTPEGILKWKVTTGDVPAHFAFTTEKLQPLE